MTGPIYPADYPSVAIYNNTKAGAVGNVSAWQEAFHKNIFPLHQLPENIY